MGKYYVIKIKQNGRPVWAVSTYVAGEEGPPPFIYETFEEAQVERERLTASDKRKIAP